jgi:hypothetical protein
MNKENCRIQNRKVLELTKIEKNKNKNIETNILYYFKKTIYSE